MRQPSSPSAKKTVACSINVDEQASYIQVQAFGIRHDDKDPGLPVCGDDDKEVDDDEEKETYGDGPYLGLQSFERHVKLINMRNLCYSLALLSSWISLLNPRGPARLARCTSQEVIGGSFRRSANLV